jgi:sugar-specific transcriptional regulator TrmB
MQEELELAGLTKIEAEVYLALLRNGQSHTGKIIKKTGLHKATVYQILERLQEKGVVGNITEKNAKTFFANDPKIILDQLKEKERRLENIMPQLRGLKEQDKTVNAQVIRGREGIIQIYNEVLKEEEYDSIGSGIPILEILGPYFYRIQKIKKDKKIKARVLISEKHKGTQFAKEMSGEYRYLPRSWEGPSNTIIYGHKIAIIIWTEKIAFVLDSPETSKSYRKYFEVLWKSANK